MLFEYCVFFFYVLFCSLLSSFIIGVSFFLVPKLTTLDKVSSYECGFQPFEDTSSKFDIKYYLVSILFIIFDLEMIFLMPWCVTLGVMDMFSTFVVLFFLLLLTVGFMYEWFCGALDWEWISLYFNMVSYMIFVRYLFLVYPKGLRGCLLKKGMCILWIDIEELVFFVNFIKSQSYLSFEMLLDVFAVDLLLEKMRFELTYLLLSVRFNYSLYLKVLVSDWFSSVFSLVSFYSSADWLESEVWDMFGIFFIGHGDMRRILTDYGFFGHALRKDFPLTGFFEVRFDDGEKRVVLEPVEIMQNCRVFNFFSPWGGFSV